jgi:hypothetical protein
MNKEYFKKRGVHLAVICGVFCVSFMIAAQMYTPTLKYEPTWHIVWEGSLAEAAEGNPGAGASGFLEIFFINHSAAPATAYDDNTSGTYETWANANLGSGVGNAWANADAFNLQIKHSVAMDVVVRARWNRTNAFNGTMFRGADCRINITASGGGITISGATSGTNVVSKNTSTNDFIWINVYWNNAAAGYVLSKGGTCTISMISIQAKY